MVKVWPTEGTEATETLPMTETQVMEVFEDFSKQESPPCSRSATEKDIMVFQKKLQRLESTLILGDSPQPEVVPSHDGGAACPDSPMPESPADEISSAQLNPAEVSPDGCDPANPVEVEVSSDDSDGQTVPPVLREAQDAWKGAAMAKAPKEEKEESRGRGRGRGKGRGRGRGRGRGGRAPKQPAATDEVEVVACPRRDLESAFDAVDDTGPNLEVPGSEEPKGKAAKKEKKEKNEEPTNTTSKRKEKKGVEKPKKHRKSMEKKDGKDKPDEPEQDPEMNNLLGGNSTFAGRYPPDSAEARNRFVAMVSTYLSKVAPHIESSNTTQVGWVETLLGLGRTVAVELPLKYIILL